MTKGTPYQHRLRSLGITQRQLAGMLGLSDNTVSRQFKGEWEMPPYVTALITALEIMSVDQREALYARLVAPHKSDQT